MSQKKRNYKAQEVVECISSSDEELASKAASKMERSDSKDGKGKAKNNKHSSNKKKIQYVFSLSGLTCNELVCQSG